MSTEGGRWSKKEQLVNAVCERPLIDFALLLKKVETANR